MARYQSGPVSSLIQELVDDDVSIHEIARLTESHYSSIYNVWQATANTVGQELAERIISLHGEHFKVLPEAPGRVYRPNLDDTLCGDPGITRYMKGCRCVECRYIAREYQRGKERREAEHKRKEH